MARGSGIIGLAQWLKTPPGRYLLEWEQRHLDTAVADIFGFHALQLGWPELDALRANRMPHRWIGVERSVPDDEAPAADAVVAVPEAEPAATRPGAEPRPRPAIALLCDFDALPFDANSLDLVVLPHALELARDPHLALREVERVLVPEGRVVIVGFNPASLWGLRQRLGELRRGVDGGAARPLFVSDAGDFLGYRRLRDWLKLLSFEIEAGRFGCYRPPVAAETWLQRYAWIESVGERWWPVFGAVYFVVAVKRVRGMRLVGMARKPQAVRNAAPAPAVAVHHHDKGGGRKPGA
ncbi:MAG: class I SAM-dependent methyltransferase [Proteobacteria bacterium]|nr:class I SAM-dependent methyltransferase [Pseudomonadota bacterium]